MNEIFHAQKFFALCSIVLGDHLKNGR